MNKLRWKGATTLKINILTLEKTQKAKSNGVSGIVNKPFLKLRNNMGRNFIVQSDSVMLLWIRRCRTALVCFFMHNSMSGQFKVIPVKLFA